MALIKACGITREEDAMAACAAGFTALGFVFAESARKVDPERAKEICDRLPPSILRVGVFVAEDADEVERVSRFCGLDLVQLHGEGTVELAHRFGKRAIPCLRPRSAGDLEMMGEFGDPFAVLIDTWNPVLAGGTGATGDWKLASLAASRSRIILAGGLNPRNVREAISIAHPFGVDVSSGVEKQPGLKDASLLKEFALAARGAFCSSPGTASKPRIHTFVPGGDGRNASGETRTWKVNQKEKGKDGS